MKRPDNKRPLSYVLLKKFGVRGACRILYQDIGFDLKHGIDTAAPVSQRRLFGADFNAQQHRYVSSTFDVMHATLDFAAELHDLEQCGFVDLGSGKGKALIAASKYPFRSLSGVEVSPRLNSTAEKNLLRLGLDKRVVLFEGSASKHDFKLHDRIIYFFNSFSGDILDEVLQKLAGAARTAPGLLIYVNPTERSHVEKYFPCLEHRWINPGQCEVSFHRLP